MFEIEDAQLNAFDSQTNTGTYQISGNLKLSKDKSTAAKLANWFRDVRDKIDNVRYFKFDKTDFELELFDVLGNYEKSRRMNKPKKTKLNEY